MSDDVATVPEALQEQPPAASDVPPAASASSSEPAAAEDPPAQGAVPPGGRGGEPKRKAGRPTGARDRVPRTRRPVVRVKPLVPETIHNRGVAPPVQPRVPTPRPVEEPPPSPRTMLRETARHLVTLRNMVDNDRRAKMHKEFSSKLQTWPIVS